VFLTRNRLCGAPSLRLVALKRLPLTTIAVIILPFLAKLNIDLAHDCYYSQSDAAIQYGCKGPVCRQINQAITARLSGIVSDSAQRLSSTDGSWLARLITLKNATKFIIKMRWQLICITAAPLVQPSIYSLKFRQCWIICHCTPTIFLICCLTWSAAH
jgi:hypothetical protein